jgi:hypothetical protein
MDDSRQVQQPPAETSDSGQIPTQPCRLCSKNSWIIDIRPGVVVDLTILKPYERVRAGKLPGHHELLTCRHCILIDLEEGVSAESRSFKLTGRVGMIGDAVERNMRDVYLAQLLFAARDLAEKRLAKDMRRVCCIECLVVAKISELLHHSADCVTGRVLRLIGALKEIPPTSQPERRPCEEVSTEQAYAAEPHPPLAPFNFAEPWTLVDEPATLEVLNADGYTVVDMAGSSLVEEEDLMYAKRIKACVNACQGIATQMLETVPPRLLEGLLRREGGAQ